MEELSSFGNYVEKNNSFLVFLFYLFYFIFFHMALWILCGSVFTLISSQ